MGIVRRHPLVTTVVALLSLPVAGLAALDAAQGRPECRRWRIEVRNETSQRYTRSHSAPAPTVHDITHGELWREMQRQVAYELRRSRPALCRVPV